MPTVKRSTAARRAQHPRRSVSLTRIERVVAEVAAERKVRVSDIRGTSRETRISRARWEAWSRLIGPQDSIASVARQWPCHHTAIIGALNKLEQEAQH